MAAPVRAYVCSTRASATAKGPFRVGDAARAQKEVLAALALDDALSEHHAWPIALYEVEVDPDRARRVNDSYLAVRSFRVLRDVPLLEAFGPRTEELVALLEQIRRFPWLAPRSAPDTERVTGLVQSHYAALGAYAPVEALPCRIVTTWNEAMNADNDALHRGPSPSPYVEATDAAEDAAQESPFAEARGNAIRKAEIVPHYLAYRAMWEAAWEVASAALIATAARTGTADARIRVRAIDRIRDKLVASRDRCRRCAWEAILAVRAHEEEPSPSPNAPTLESMGKRSDPELMHAWLPAWNFANMAVGTVGRAGRYMVSLPDAPNPSAPLVELLRMGAWPIDEVDGAFVVFFRAPGS
jgi:hypothetical protein